MQIDLTPEQAEFIRHAVDAAEASLARGEGTAITRDSMRKLAEDVSRRGRARHRRYLR
jgi:hypothetical protein